MKLSGAPTPPFNLPPADGSAFAKASITTHETMTNEQQEASYAQWYVGCAYPKGQQVVTEQEDGRTYLVATAHANGDDYRQNARMIAAAPKALHLLERLAGFAAHYASESAIQAGGDLLIAEAEGLLREVRGR